MRISDWSSDVCSSGLDVERSELAVDLSDRVDGGADVSGQLEAGQRRQHLVDGGDVVHDVTRPRLGIVGQRPVGVYLQLAVAGVEVVQRCPGPDRKSVV